MKTVAVRAAAAGTFVLAAAPAWADEKDDRIERLERETSELRRELEELKEGRAGGADKDAIQAAVDDYLARVEARSSSYVGPGGALRPAGNVSIGGYFTTRWSASEEPGKKHSFVDVKLVPQLHAEITKNIHFNAEVEIEHGGISDEIDGEIVVEYAELLFRCGDAFTFKAGTLLVPFGAFNLNHDDPLNELSSRPTVARYVVPSAFDLPGIGAMGALDLNDDTSLTYDVVLTNGFRDEFNSEDGSREARGLFEEDDNHDKTAFGRVGLVPTVAFLEGLNVGASGAFGKVGEQGDRLRGYGFDASARHGPWEFKGEYDKFGIDRGEDAAPPIDSSGALGPIRGLHGWYAQLLYRFTDAWVRTLPFAEDDASLAVVVRRDSVDLNDRVHGASPRDDERAWSFGVTYRPTSKTAVKVEWRHARSGAQGELGSDRDLFVVEFSTYF